MPKPGGCRWNWPPGEVRATREGAADHRRAGLCVQRRRQEDLCGGGCAQGRWLVRRSGGTTEALRVRSRQDGRGTAGDTVSLHTRTVVLSRGPRLSGSRGKARTGARLVYDRRAGGRIPGGWGWLRIWVCSSTSRPSVVPRAGWLASSRNQTPRRAHGVLCDGEETIGAVVRTRSRVKPVFVSVGHKCTLEDAIRITLACATRYRVPEPSPWPIRRSAGSDNT